MVRFVGSPYLRLCGAIWFDSHCITNLYYSWRKIESIKFMVQSYKNSIQLLPRNQMAEIKIYHNINL